MSDEAGAIENSAAEGIKLIREWLVKVPYMPKPDDALLKRFYTSCKGSVERTKQVLELYYSVRRGIPDFFGNRDPMSDEMKHIRDVWNFFALPKKLPNGCEVYISQMKSADHPDWSVDGYAKHTFMVVDIQLEDPDPYEGTVLIYDFGNYNMGDVAKLTPAFFKKYVLCAQDALPIRIKEMHLVNAPRYAEIILSLLKPFLKEKIRDRIKIHTEMEGLHKYVPKDVLPAEFGGNEVSVDRLHERWLKNLEAHRDWFLAEEKKLAELPERPQKLQVENDLLGTDGTFRKITVD